MSEAQKIDKARMRMQAWLDQKWAVMVEFAGQQEADWLLKLLEAMGKPETPVAMRQVLVGLDDEQVQVAWSLILMGVVETQARMREMAEAGE